MGGENQLWSIWPSGSGWAVPPRKAPQELVNSVGAEEGWGGPGPPPSSSTSCSGILGHSRLSAGSTQFNCLPKSNYRIFPVFCVPSGAFPGWSKLQDRAVQYSCSAEKGEWHSHRSSATHALAVPNSPCHSCGMNQLCPP